MNPEDITLFLDLLPKNQIQKSKDGQLEIDLEKLPNKVVRQIDMFVRSKLPPRKINAIKQKKSKKAQEKEKEKEKQSTTSIVPVSFFNSGSKTTRKGNT